MHLQQTDATALYSPMLIHHDVTGLLLAGGHSSRLGRSKALEPFLGEPMLTRVAKRMAAVTRELLVVVESQATADTLPIPQGAKVVLDVYAASGPLGGIYSGLSAAATPWVIAAACDLPFLDPALLEYLLEQRGSHQAVAPLINGRPEPTHAVYSRACVAPLLARLQSGRLKAGDILEDLDVAYITEEALQRVNPGLTSFFNVNTQADLDKALAIAKGGRFT